MTGWTTDLLAGVAEYAAAQGAAAWNPAGTYPTGPGIFLAHSPDAPHQVVILTPYGPLNQWDDGDVLQGLQVKTRGTPHDPTTTFDLRDTIRDLLDGLGGTGLFTFGGVLVSQVFHDSGTSLGEDESGRLVWSDNYHIQAARPTALRN